jgi:hypothetical protein
MKQVAEKVKLLRANLKRFKLTFFQVLRMGSATRFEINIQMIKFVRKYNQRDVIMCTTMERERKVMCMFVYK